MEASRFDIAQAWYWWLTDHHEGQWSEKYARLCKLSRSYRPGMMERGPEEGSVAEIIYQNLCEKAGCDHD